MGHTYWRLFIVQNDGSGFSTSIVEVECYDAAGNLLNVGGTAFASSSVGGFPPSNAFDNNLGTRWAANVVPTTTSPLTLGYQFTGPVDLFTIRLTSTGGGFGPSVFKVQYSDNGSTYTDATGYFNFTLGYGSSQSATIGLAPGGTYVNYRLRVTGVNSGGSTFRPAELLMKIFAGGATVTQGPTYAIGTGIFSGFSPPANAFDGNINTYSEIFNANWIGYSFKQPYRIIEVDWTAVNDGTYVNTQPTLLYLEGSNDFCRTWTTITSFTPAAWTAAGQTQIFGVVPDQRGNIAYNQIRASHREGAGQQFLMFGGGAAIQNHGLMFDGQGNAMDSNMIATGFAGTFPPVSTSIGIPGTMAYDPATGTLYLCYNNNLWAKFTPSSISF